MERATIMYQDYETHGQLGFVHTLTGVRTLTDELEKAAWHNARHLSQIRTARGRSSGATPHAAEAE
jgi:hypothetical protein